MLVDISAESLTNLHCVFRYITEVGHRNNISICARTGGNEHIYTSNGRHVQIHINTRDKTSDKDFMLEYKGNYLNAFKFNCVYLCYAFRYFQCLGALI